ncbi:very short patch repair endonuclease [Chryseobacterium binzhouense]|uniref:very short patch repair endonuclease n=1 Tax=Chryseobacterium binzhouense TaxID=2593646 RepID=UPI001180724F|nr:DNA mismatch endonuclease Vsr [Chryseobacterium binzhouense]
MKDKFSKEKRSEIMSKIKKTNTKPEMIVRKFLFSQGLRYRIHNKKLIGNPDIVLPKYKTIIFVNGCFWHAHNNCKLNRMPKSNTDYWIPKILRNVERDEINRVELEKLGWNVITVWECELGVKKREDTLIELYNKIKTE